MNPLHDCRIWDSVMEWVAPVPALNRIDARSKTFTKLIVARTSNRGNRIYHSMDGWRIWQHTGSKINQKIEKSSVNLVLRGTKCRAATDFTGSTIILMHTTNRGWEILTQTLFHLKHPSHEQIVPQTRQTFSLTISWQQMWECHNRYAAATRCKNHIPLLSHLLSNAVARLIFHHSISCMLQTLFTRLTPLQNVTYVE